MKRIDKLYQYRTINKYTILNLLNNRIRLSSPKLFNDPYDCKINLNQDNIYNKVMDNLKKEGKLDKLIYLDEGTINVKEMMNRARTHFFFYLIERSQ